MKIEDFLILGAGAYLLLSSIATPSTAVSTQDVQTSPAPSPTPTAKITAQVQGVGPLGTGVTVAYVDPATQKTYGEYNTPQGKVSGVISPIVLAASTTTQSAGSTPKAAVSTPQAISNQVQQSFGVKQTATVNNVVIPITHNQAQNTNNTLRALKGLPPV